MSLLLVLTLEHTVRSTTSHEWAPLARHRCVRAHRGLLSEQVSSFWTLELDVVIPNSGSESCSIVLVPVPCSAGQLTSNQPIAIGSLNHGHWSKQHAAASKWMQTVHQLIFMLFMKELSYGCMSTTLSTCLLAHQFICIKTVISTNKSRCPTHPVWWQHWYMQCTDDDVPTTILSGLP